MEPAQTPHETWEFSQSLIHTYIADSQSPIHTYIADFVGVAKIFAAMYVVFCSETQKENQTFQK